MKNEMIEGLSCIFRKKKKTERVALMTKKEENNFIIKIFN